MIFKRRRLLKAVALFFVFEIIFSAFSPAISYALTSGPTAPEATSFEPVDTTDMVNLATGDLVYNIPLLEVPGPAGGYPLSLSYHAGIQPNEEASWVGLGWTLNPGAITRSVNGFADDHFGQTDFSRFYWAGGSRESYSIGVSVGLYGVASVNANLTISQDTYQGFGVGGSLGVGVHVGNENSPLSVGVKIGVSPYGDPYMSVGANVSIGTAADQVSGSIGVGVRVSSSGVGYYASAGLDYNQTKNERVRSRSLMDVSLSSGTKGVYADIGIAGATYSNGGTGGRVRTSSKGFTLPIPVYYGVTVTLGYNYQRYWIDEIDDFKVNGALYYPDGTDNLTIDYFDENVFDSYSLLQPELEGGIVDNPEPDKLVGGTFPGYDHYQVHAQGVYGVMRPFYFQRHLYKRNNYHKNEDGGKVHTTLQRDIAKDYPGERNYRAEFRFLNDFANRFEYTPSTATHKADEANPFSYSFENGSGLKVGEMDNTYASNQVQGTRHIEWLTNNDIVNGAARAQNARFIETVSSGFDRATPNDESDDHNIGAFVITNESGVKYHFGLPAYSFMEYMYSGKKTGTETFNEFIKPSKYAYTWYLTAITGPDYVDRGPDGSPDGKLNQYDWGYWVEFEYGKWTEHFGWRTPAEGMITDVDEDFQNYSEGLKELYYLDAIRTQTHTAIFVKDVRHDAKGTVSYRMNKSRVLGFQRTKYTVDSKSRAGGFMPTPTRCECKTVPALDYGYLDYTPLPASSLKLRSIVLVDNSIGEFSKSEGSQFEQVTQANWTVITNASNGTMCDFSPVEINYHLYENVFDVYDLASNSQINQHTIRRIDFNTDNNTLVNETPNSFDFELVKGPNPPTENSAYPKYGKLSLQSIQTVGKNGVSGSLPPVKFSYELDETNHTALVSKDGDDFSFDLANSPLEEGDLIKFSKSGLPYYGLIESITGSLHKMRSIGKNKLSSSQRITFTRTKNPPYQKDHFDKWGLYKSDYHGGGDERISRQVTTTSSKALDVWSLRTITTPTGGKIRISYDSDTHGRPALYSSDDLIIKSMSKSGPFTKIVLESSAVEVRDLLRNGRSIRYSICFADPYLLSGILPKFATNYRRDVLNVHSVSLNNGQWEILTDTNMDHFFELKPNRGEDVQSNQVFVDPPEFVVGNLSLDDDFVRYGGGLRVKEISLETPDFTKSTIYDYSSTSGKPTSGTISYEPGGANKTKFYYPTGSYYEFEESRENLEKTFKKEYYKDFATIIANSRELPPPGVIYATVSVQEAVRYRDELTNLHPFKTIYEFETFTEDLVSLSAEDEVSETFSTRWIVLAPFFPYTNKKSRIVKLKDFTARIGSLKSMTLWDTEKNIKVSQTRNQYLHDLAEDNEDYASLLKSKLNGQGLIEETFTDSRWAKLDDGNAALAVISKREQYPLVQIGQTTTNYISGIISSTENIAFDFYSGAVTKTVAKDGYGSTYLTEVVPAYRIYDDMGLGSAGHKNMLMQTASSATFLINENNYDEKYAVLNATVETWTDQTKSIAPGQSFEESESQPGIWRKHRTYNFIGDDNVALQKNGLYPFGSFVPFNAWEPIDNTPQGWEKMSEITLVDVFSHALEAKDINGLYATTLMSADQTRVFASAANCSYSELAFTGAEEEPVNGYLSGHIQPGSNVTLDGSKAHTGKYSIRIPAGTTGLNVTLNKTSKSTSFKVSCWVHQDNTNNLEVAYQISQKTSSSIIPHSSGQVQFVANTEKKAGEWYLMEGYIPVPAGPDEEYVIEAGIANTGSAAAFVDDFRIHPKDAAVTSYVYNEWGELSFILSDNNLFTQFEYDDVGRLRRTHMETFKHNKVQTSENEYHYAVQR